MLQLGDILLRNKILETDVLNKAIESSRKQGKLLGDYLLENKLITEEQRCNALSMQSGMAIINLANEPIDYTISGLIKQDICVKYSLVPYRIEGKVLYIAVSDPYCYKEITTIKKLTGKDIKMNLSTKSSILTFISQLFGEYREKTTRDELHRKEIELKNQSKEIDLRVNSEVEDDAVVKLLANTLESALNEGTSDIHIEPQKDTVAIKFRLDGDLHLNNTINRILLDNLIRHIKTKSNLDTTKTKTPQDGRFTVKNSTGADIDVRVSILPVLYGEKCVMRLLDKDKKIPLLSNLGLVDDDLNKIRRMINKPFGLILVCGPTGSGKSTSLSSILNEIKSPEKNIVTLEDPIEYVIDGINQSNVDPKVGYTFSVGLRTLLRQDPDIIMVGEIRDEETAKMAMSAATTGHLVFSTIHTNDSVGAVTRLADMGIESYHIANSLIGVISQRLLKRVCSCHKTEIIDIAKQKILGVDYPAPISVASSCPLCREGYKGRLPIVELLEITPELREIISENGANMQLLKYLKNTEFKTLRDNANERVLAGDTTLEEAFEEIGVQE